MTTSLVSIAENSYRTDLLERMAVAMNISKQLLALEDGLYYKYLIYNNRPITIIVEQNEVSHIGFSLFSPSQREAIKYPICDFLERYSLEITLPLKREKSVARQLDEDGIFFHNGSLDFLKQLQNDSTYQINIEYLNGKRYRVSWSKDGEEHLAVYFPIEHDLLVGTNMLENERRIIKAICRSSSLPQPMHLADSTLLKITWQGNYFILPGDVFYTKQLNSNQYFSKDKQGRYSLLYNHNFVLESLSNLMTTGVIENDYDLQIRLVKYGFTQDTIFVKLNQWINYCLRQGCTPHFGIISVDNNTADCEVIMRNSSMGYIHVMRLTFDISTIEDRKGLVKARLNSYIPTNRVKYLFDELKK